MLRKDLDLLALQSIQQLSDDDYKSYRWQVFAEMLQQGVIASAFYHGFPGPVRISAENNPCIVHIHGQHPQIEGSIALKAVKLQKLQNFLQADHRFLSFQSLRHGECFFQQLFASGKRGKSDQKPADPLIQRL